MAYRFAKPNRRSGDTRKCDVLVIGSGIAGLMLCHELAGTKLQVVLACKQQLIDSNTSWAQGGLAAVTGSNPFDSPARHLEDTLSAGAGLTEERVARTIVEGGARLVDKLCELGVPFDRSNGRYDAALEGGHSQARVLHSKDASGRAISTTLIKALEAPNMHVWENAFATDLIVLNGRCIGAHFLVNGERTPVFARHVVLATGGLGQVFARTTNPAVATGDGIAMAFRAGASLIDMEFVQFHPTALALPGAPAELISEAVRGAGAILLNQDGERFAFRYHRNGELATRDIVARAIYNTMQEEHLSNVWLDLRPIGKENISERFPNIVSACRKYGIDPLEQTVPIAPAAHYFMGGILADTNGHTTLPGLYAVGECASTGLHGANRLASNSLLEGGVMALQLADTIKGDGGKLATPRTSVMGPAVIAPQYRSLTDLQTFRNAMFDNVGLERSQSGLESIVNGTPDYVSEPAPSHRATAEASNIALLGWLIARSALERRESRGAHWRADFPMTNDSEFARRFFVSKAGSGWLPIGVSTTAMPTPARSAFV